MVYSKYRKTRGSKTRGNKKYNKTRGKHRGNKKYNKTRGKHRRNKKYNKTRKNRKYRKYIKKQFGGAFNPEETQLLNTFLLNKNLIPEEVSEIISILSPVSQQFSTANHNINILLDLINGLPDAGDEDDFRIIREQIIQFVSEHELDEPNTDDEYSTDEDDA
jgi:hypothetical protein